MLATPILAAALALTQSVPGEGAVPCSGDWVPAFGSTIGVEGAVNALLDIGGVTIVGGSFVTAGGQAIGNVARFDGEDWHPLGPGLNSEVLALGVLGAPDAPRIFAGGLFQALPGSLAEVSSVAEFDGQGWSAPGGGFGGATVDFELWHDESGESLLALNQAFSSQGDITWRVGRYGGTSWESISPLHLGTARRVVVNDDGTGPRIYVVGQNMVGADGIPRQFLVWDGTAWQATGTNEPIGNVTAVTSFDWGQGPRLTAAGLIAGVTPATLSLAYLEGTNWVHTPVGIQGFPPSKAIVSLVPAQLQPEGPVELFGLGDLYLGDPAKRSVLFRWQGDAFANVLNGQVNLGITGLRNLERVAGAEGDRLLIGGLNFTLDGAIVRNVASYSSAGIDALGLGLRGTVYDTALRETPAGPEFYLVGGPLSIGSKSLGSIARYAGGEWHSEAKLGVGADGGQRLFVDEESPTSDLYAAGDVVRRFDGTTWTQLGGTLPGSPTSLLWFEPPGGERELHLGLARTSTTPWSSLRRFDGSVWQSVLGNANGSVNALCVFDDGSGPALYVGGNFTQIDGQPAKSLVRYDGKGWTELGASLVGVVQAMAVYDSGNGPQLHVAGPIAFADGVPVKNVVRLDGGVWSAVGEGLVGDVQTLTVHDSPAGPLLVAAGLLLAPESQTPRALARWDGEHWAFDPDTLFGGKVLTARSHLWPGDLEPTLHVGGTFTAVGDNRDSHFARWGCPQQAPLVNPIPSCQPSAVALASSASFAPLGGALPLAVSAGATSEVAVVLLGLPFTAGQGCGLELVGLGELWLDPLQTISVVAVGAPLLGSFATTLPVPSTPGLFGLEIALQAASLEGPAATLSNALSVVLGP
ncbi:MAG: hypothetical protein GC161_15595 [Planctomycetaceae bacterium]|nr:hypothetical protein [Planctomycetaceae bacterium]